VLFDTVPEEQLLSFGQFWGCGPHRMPPINMLTITRVLGRVRRPNGNGARCGRIGELHGESSARREKGVEEVILKWGFPNNLSSTFHQQPP
jgi:hypothetical protein